MTDDVTKPDTSCPDEVLKGILEDMSSPEKFDFRDEEAKERVFKNHGFTEEQMKELVEDLDRNTRRSYKSVRCAPATPAPTTCCPVDFNDKYVEGLKVDRLEKSKRPKLGFFATIKFIIESKWTKTVNTYRNIRHRFSFYIRGKLPRIECTEEHFCEKHQREYDVIFHHFKHGKGKK
jgi:hypothetical protein